MAKNVRILIGISLLMMTANALIVPYRSKYGGHLGYGFIGAPVKYSFYDGKTFSKTRDSSIMRDGEIDFARIGLQAGAIIVAALGMVALTRRRNAK